MRIITELHTSPCPICGELVGHVAGELTSRELSELEELGQLTQLQLNLTPEQPLVEGGGTDLARAERREGGAA